MRILGILKSNILITDLKKIKQLGILKEDENFQFRSFLKMQDSDEVDRIVNKLNDYYSKKIDCKKCGNCCKELQSLVNKNDIKRLAFKLDISEDSFIKNYTETDEEGDLLLRHKPCKFLKDKKCEIYEYRPEDCKSFPHLHKERFISRLFGVINNYSVCPIVFNVYEDLKEHFNFNRKKNEWIF